MADEPLVRSIPRRTDGWGQNFVMMQNDAMHQNLRAGVPMSPVTGPVTGIDVNPHTDGKSFTSTPTSQIGPVGGQNSEPTTGKVFGSAMDARLFPAVPFSGVMKGPGSAPLDKAPFNPAVLGNTTTQTPGYRGLSPSGRGLLDQPDPTQFSRGSGSNLLPTEKYHPQISTSPSISGRKRYFR